MAGYVAEVNIDQDRFRIHWYQAFPDLRASLCFKSYHNLIQVTYEGEARPYVAPPKPAYPAF